MTEIQKTKEQSFPNKLQMRFTYYASVHVLVNLRESHIEGEMSFASAMT